MGHNEQTLPTPGDINKHIEKVEQNIQNSIMYRFDLFNVNLAKGGIDIKILNNEMLKDNQCFARNGPAGTYQFLQP